MKLLMTEMSHDIISSPLLAARGWILYGQNNNKKDVFHQFELVNKFNLETQNPKRDTPTNL